LCNPANKIIEEKIKGKNDINLKMIIDEGI